MADEFFPLGKPRQALGETYQIGEVEGSWQRLEPILSPAQLRAFHLFGIPLVSVLRDPFTGARAVITDDLLKQYIDRSVALAELETGLIITPTKFIERHPFDKAEYEALGYFRTRQRPVTSVEGIRVTPANDIDVYMVPTEWIEGGYLQYGQINIIPLTLALSSGGTVVSTQSAAGGALFLAIFGYMHWIPAFWKIEYTAGFKDGKVPTILNELIGTIAAMEVLSMLAATFAQNQGASLSLDGVSQSISGPGPNIFAVRLGELGDKRKRIVTKLKALYGAGIIVGNL